MHARYESNYVFHWLLYYSTSIWTRRFDIKYFSVKHLSNVIKLLFHHIIIYNYFQIHYKNMKKIIWRGYQSQPISSSWGNNLYYLIDEMYILLRMFFLPFRFRGLWMKLCMYDHISACVNYNGFNNISIWVDHMLCYIYCA